MERKKNLINIFSNDKIIQTIIIIFFSVGIIGHIVLLKPMVQITSLTLFFLILLISTSNYFFLSKVDRKRFLIFVFMVFTITLIIEIVGVKTSLIFGRYHYPNILQPRIFGVPLIIGLNWVFVVLGSYALSCKLFGNVYLKIIMSAVFSVFFDFVMEPIAIKLQYWEWLDNVGLPSKIIPFQNYLSWFVLSLIISYLIYKFKIHYKSNIIITYWFAQLFFFQLLQIIING